MHDDLYGGYRDRLIGYYNCSQQKPGRQAEILVHGPKLEPCDAAQLVLRVGRAAPNFPFFLAYNPLYMVIHARELTRRVLGPNVRTDRPISSLVQTRSE